MYHSTLLNDEWMNNDKHSPGSLTIKVQLIQLIDTTEDHGLELRLNGVPWDAMSIVLLRGGQPLLPSYSELFILFSGPLGSMPLRCRSKIHPAKLQEIPQKLENQHIYYIGQ